MIAPSPALRISAFVFAALVLLLFFRPRILPFNPPQIFHRRLKISVLETKGCHDEVSTSFFGAFGQLPDCEVDGFLAAKRFGIEAIYDQLPGSTGRTLDSIDSFQPAFYEQYQPDIVVSITSEYDFIANSTKPTFDFLLEHTECILFAVVHHPDEWRTAAHLEAVKPWIESKRVRFITLSNHVSNYMVATVVNTWGNDVDINSVHVSTFPPVFTIPFPTTNETESAEHGTVRFAMQGDLIVDRRPNRDYTGTFKRFAELLAREHSNELELRVLGNGRLPPVPAEAAENIIFDVALPYPEFYEILHSATAVLPAFASPDYLRSKASSTIPASFVAGVPLIAGDDLLSAYTFVTKEDVYYRYIYEDEIDVMARIARLTKEQRLEKSRNLRAKSELMTKETSQLLRLWISESLVERGL